jgi:predicted lipoprotein
MTVDPRPAETLTPEEARSIAEYIDVDVVAYWAKQAYIDAGKLMPFLGRNAAVNDLDSLRRALTKLRRLAGEDA